MTTTSFQNEERLTNFFRGHAAGCDEGLSGELRFRCACGVRDPLSSLLRPKNRGALPMCRGEIDGFFGSGFWKECQGLGGFHIAGLNHEIPFGRLAKYHCNWLPGGDFFGGADMFRSSTITAEAFSSWPCFVRTSATLCKLPRPERICGCHCSLSRLA